MESDEKYIKLHFGKEQHFVVPDGYLEGLANSILDKVDECMANQPDVLMPKATVAGNGSAFLWRHLRKYVAVAACLSFVVCGAVAYFVMHDAGQNVASVANHKTEESTTYTYDEIADFSMLDNEDIYSLVASN